MRFSMHKGIAVAALSLTAACVAAGGNVVPPSDPELPPAGFGTFDQGRVTIAVQADQVLVRVIPMHQAVLRTLAPDTYRALNRLSETYADSIESLARSRALGPPVVFLVSLAATNQETRFNPQDLQISSPSGFFRPQVIIPLTPSWGTNEIRARQTQRALYVFRTGLDVLQPFEVEFSGARSRDWHLKLPDVRAELGRVRVRAGLRSDGG